MVQLAAKFSFLLAFVAAAQGAPVHEKRIAQTIIDSVQPWENACNAAGGGQQCNPIAVAAAETLLAAADVCAQQNSADQMVDLAKQLNNDAAMIKAAQIFVQQPRNTPTSLSTPYCQQAPKNEELNGLFQCQFQGAKAEFVGNLAAGQPGTIPFGLNAPLDPAGSCPANPQGPIPDGQQLSDLAQDPGVGNAGNAGNNNSSNGGGAGNNSSASSAAGNATATGGNATGTAVATATGSAATATATSAAGTDDCTDDTDTAIDTADPTATSDSTLSAPAVTATATATSSAASNGTGAAASTGGAASATAQPAASSTASAGASAGNATGNTGGSGDFKLQNGKDAQALNAKFASLTQDSTCNDGENACVEGGFAQCVGGKFMITQCSGGTQCFALPLVNSPGTSLTCDTEADAAARIAASGAQGGLTGSGN